ncbi:MAG: hypothetical protein ACMUEL_08345 [Flavobacteriales bacterium Tduv]
MSKTRWVIEPTYSSIKRWFESEGKTLYKVLARMHDQPIIEDMAHNLYRSPGIIIRYL